MDMASVSLTFSSSIVPSPIPQHKCNKTQHKLPIFRVIRCAVSPPPSVVKKKHWKQGEFPGFSETPGTRRKPIKNIKKKLDRKNDAKAWVSTVTEALSERIDKKQWLQALEVLSLLSNSLLYYVSLFKI
jgi:hypothetical protein